MVNETEHFSERLSRIQRRRRPHGMGFVVHSDGVISPIGRPSSRLRFGFPLKGLLLAFVIAVTVKAYLMWILGTEVYVLEVQTLLSGTAFEQMAGMILMPDGLSAWVVERYNEIHAFIQAGLAANTSA